MSLHDIMFWMVRIVAGVGGAFVGWLITPSLVRVLVRLAFHRPLPGWLVPWVRLAGAALFGLLLAFCVHLGGGFGWGPGGGGYGLGPGPGDGKGSDGKGADGKASDKKDDSVTKKDSLQSKARDALSIEVLGGQRYKGDRRWYILEGKEPARTLAEVDEFLENNRDKYKTLYIILRPDSAAQEHPAVKSLQERAIQKHKLLALIENAP
jgi:hypothetical protein